jgi:hypothetical protein
MKWHGPLRKFIDQYRRTLDNYILVLKSLESSYPNFLYKNKFFNEIISSILISIFIIQVIFIYKHK